MTAPRSYEWRTGVAALTAASWPSGPEQAQAWAGLLAAGDLTPSALRLVAPTAAVGVLAVRTTLDVVDRLLGNVDVMGAALDALSAGGQATGEDLGLTVGHMIELTARRLYEHPSIRHDD